MQKYLVESHHHLIEHRGRTSRGRLAQPLPSCDRRSEKIYLHVIALEPAEIAKMKVRLDDDGNEEHDRWSLPKSHFVGIVDWWVATQGGHAWPRFPGKPLCSTCVFSQDGIPTPKPLDEQTLALLAELSADLP